MKNRVARGTVRAIWVLGALEALALPGSAQTLVETSSETLLQLDLQVADDVLAPYLPKGWSLNVATQGNAKDCNLRVIFVDRVAINGPDGKPAGNAGSNQFVYLAAPVKDSSGAAAQLMIGGLTADPANAPGPFGVYLPATTHSMQHSISNSAGPILESEDWVFTAATGEHLELHIKYERSVPIKGNPTEVRFYSAKNPDFFQISKQEQVLNILRNVTTNPPDRVKEFSFKASGGSYSKLFDGKTRVVSWDHFPQLQRRVMQP
jgi:hypothetical protein